MPTIVQRISEYQKLLAVQYRTLPKARATIGIYVKQVIGDGLAFAVRDGFNIDTAVGNQLDVLGKYIGLSRNIGEPVDLPYYGFWDSQTDDDPATQNPNGMQDGTDPSVNAQSIFYDATSSLTRNTDLDDVAYRFMLKWKIILNSSDGTLASIDAMIQLLLPNVVELVDNCDMTMTYTLGAAIPVSPYVLEPYLPKPMGVGVNFVFLRVTVAPTSYAHTFHVSAPALVTSGALVATPVGGTGPYTYSWVLISSTTVDLSSPFAEDDTAASTTIHVRLYSLISATSIWKCVVTDAIGLVAESDPVSVTLAIDGPP